MSNYKDKPHAPSIDMAEMSFDKPRCSDDCYYWRGSDFPAPDANTAKGKELGTEGLTGGQSAKQKSPRQNAQDGPNEPTVKGKEGQAFPPDANSKDSEDEAQTFAGSRESSVSVNLVSGQVASIKGDAKSNRI